MNNFLDDLPQLSGPVNTPEKEAELKQEQLEYCNKMITIYQSMAQAVENCGPLAPPTYRYPLRKK